MKRSRSERGLYERRLLSNCNHHGVMPTILREGPYRVHFYAQDRPQEPPHVHVQRDRNEAKFWLDPVRLERSGGFSRHELREIRRLLETHEQDLLDAWNAYS